MSHIERLESDGLNCVRSSMAYELSVHIYLHRENAQRLEGTIEHLVDDPSAAVRVMAIRCLSGLMRWDAPRAVELFLQLASHPDDGILGTRQAHEFLRYAGPRHYQQLQNVLQRMLDSPLDQVRTSGAVQIGLVALDGETAQDLAHYCLTGDPALRLGTARVNAANVRAARYRDRCLNALEQHFNDAEANIRKAAAQAFHELAQQNFAGSEKLIVDFLTSPHFGDDSSTRLLHALDEAEAPPPELALRVCRAFLETTGIDDPADSHGSRTFDVSELAVRAYADAEDDAGRSRALDVIDIALERGAYRAIHALREHDRP
jgi:HEAT repeat protein